MELFVSMPLVNYIVSKGMNQIISVLVNGNINRLRAFACSQILAEDLGFELKVVWLNEKNCIADAQYLFEESFYQRFFITEFDFQQLFKKDPRTIPMGLQGVNSSVLSIRGKSGGRKGEQFYLNQLLAQNVDLRAYEKIIIFTGGLFYLKNFSRSGRSPELRKRRNAVYQNINFSEEIVSTVEKLKSEIGNDYIGLHLRYKDLIARAPSIRRAVKELKRISSEQRLKNIYISSDAKRKLNKILSIIKKMNLNGNSFTLEPLPRHSPGSNREALINWLMLSESSYLIRFRSSFSQEAAIRGGNLVNNQSVLSSGRVLFILKLPMQFVHVFSRKIFYRLKKK